MEELLSDHPVTIEIPLTFPDTVTVGARVSALAPKGFMMQYTVASRRHAKIAAEGDGRIVTVNYTDGGKAPLPEPVRTRIQALEGERLAAH